MADMAITALSGMLTLVPDRLPREDEAWSNPVESLSVPHAPRVEGSCRMQLRLAELCRADGAGAYEPETRDVILEFLPEKGTLIDVGANIGALAIPVAKMRPQASIICIEADPEISGSLQDNVNRNGCKCISTICCIAGET